MSIAGPRFEDQLKPMTAMDALLRLDRRRLFALIAGGVVTAGLAGCEENSAVGRQQLILVSDEQLLQLTRQVWADTKAKTPISKDPALTGPVRTVGRRVADVSGLTGVEWEFVVFDTPQVNAFVLPGGKVAVHRGLMRLLGGNPDELAAVIGHEASHVLARHAAERVSQQAAVEAGAALAGAAIGEDNAREVSAALGAGLLYGVVLPYSRRHELEADRLGVGLAARAGFDPSAALGVMRKLIEAGGDAPIPFLSTHPAGQDRIAALQQELARLNAPQAG
jgi:predicted Zn-dependent protease